MVAVVGSRNASGAGLKFTQRIARELGEAGFAVVSGLARGIDAAAHAASLATGTVAVLAGGQDRVYPPEHAQLLDDILTAGAAISEMPLGWEPRARIVALLGPTPVQIDDLVRLSKSSPAAVRMVLLELEIAGRLERHGGSLVSLA
jgi:predicted Rossmann fold nucleotide-binding protein DprA/Smf involved in DNA uptake